MFLTDSDLRRFWSKVALPTSTGCMLWKGARTGSGYGNFAAAGHYYPAHRLSLLLADGTPAPGMDAAHGCRNRHCVAPTHLRWATRQENLADRVEDDTMNHGERNGQAILTASQVVDIRTRYTRGGVTQKQLGLEFGVCRQTIGLIVNGKNWSYLESAS